MFLARATAEIIKDRKDGLILFVRTFSHEDEVICKEEMSNKDTPPAYLDNFLTLTNQLLINKEREVLYTQNKTERGD